MRRSVLTSTIVAVLIAALALGLAGCGDDDDAASTAATATSSQAGANAEFCASLDDLQSAVGDLTALDPSTTSLDQLSSTVAALGTAWTGVVSSAKDATGVDTSALSDAWDGVIAATKDLAGSGSLTVAAQNVEDAVAPLETAIQDLRPECGTTTGATTTGQ
ncbi:MAG TPA: hypothetical protein PKD59_05845 [Miltoncostaeaceae bacterium]|nr:hypothetical protein [Miltoncostaeaceae bacterium]